MVMGVVEALLEIGMSRVTLGGATEVGATIIGLQAYMHKGNGVE